VSQVRVNLLPREIGEKNAAARQRVVAAAGGAGFVLLLGAIYVLQGGALDDAQEQLALEQAELAALQADLAALGEYAELQQRRSAAAALLGTALAGETSYAGVLQDIAAVFPDDAELSSLTISTVRVEEGESASTLGDTRLAYGEVSAVGRTLASFAPGIERLLLDFDKVASFTDVFLTNSAVDQDGAVSFTVEVDLGAEVRTGRYLDGLPEELR
jgi:Tfp pilus assembly protein PilN